MRKDWTVLPHTQERDDVCSVYVTAELDILFHAETSQNFRVVCLLHDIMEPLFPEVPPQSQGHLGSVATGGCTFFQTHPFLQKAPHKKPRAQRVIQRTPAMTSRTEDTDALPPAQRLFRGGPSVPGTGGEHGMTCRCTPKQRLRSVRRGEEQTHSCRTREHFPG